MENEVDEIYQKIKIHAIQNDSLNQLQNLANL